MATTFYVHGPNDTWLGVCEMHEDRQHYVYHSAWPERKPLPVNFRDWYMLRGDMDHLTNLVANGQWVPMLDARLLLPQGV